MSTFLTADELAELIGCQPNSKACMCRWLEKHGWPYEPNRAGFPQVARAYYDQRMLGTAPPADNLAAAPNRAALLKRIQKDGRKKKAA